MKKVVVKFSLFVFFVCFATVALSFQEVKAVDECSKELLLEYFPKQFVVETLKKYNVPQEKWDEIAASLSNKDKEVVKIVEEKASKLNPNPLKDRDPQQRQVAVKLFRETLLQVFSEALQANGVTDQSQVQVMLDDIQQQKAKNFAMCMEKQKASMQPRNGEPAQQPAESQPIEAPEARLEVADPSDLIADNDHEDEENSSNSRKRSDTDEEEHDDDEEHSEDA